jgi:hypothetical protein
MFKFSVCIKLSIKVITTNNTKKQVEIPIRLPGFRQKWMDIFPETCEATGS